MSGVELAEIRRNIEDLPYGEVQNANIETEGTTDLQDRVDMRDAEDANNSVTDQQNEHCFDLNSGCTLNNEEEQMVFKIKEILNKTRDRLPPLKGLQKSKITVEPKQGEYVVLEN